MLRLIPDGDFAEIVADMSEAIKDVHTGEITTAVRSVEVHGVPVQEGQIIGLYNDELVTAATSVEEACLDLLKKAKAEDYELITLFYGESMQKPEVNRIADLIRAAYPEQEIEVQEGGQPHYHFIISIE